MPAWEKIWENTNSKDNLIGSWSVLYCVANASASVKTAKTGGYKLGSLWAWSSSSS